MVGSSERNRLCLSTNRGEIVAQGDKDTHFCQHW